VHEPGRLDVGGEPVHTRAQSVRVRRRDDRKLVASGSLLDLRTRGFLPVGGDMQGMGIIHHMELEWVLDAATATIERWTPAQPTVAFEAGPETGGESCRDPIARLDALAGRRLGSGLSQAVRDRIGGPLGCSHLVTLALFMDAALRAGLAEQAAADADARGTLFRRDLVFDGHAHHDGRIEIAIRLADLHWNARGAGALAPERLALHDEIAAVAAVDLWPGRLVAIRGAERRRTPDRFAAVGWNDRTAMLASLADMGLARGATSELATRLGDGVDVARWRDALAMLPPALVQCRAAHPDAWHEKVRATPRHPGLTALPDSCWMWRRDGALAKIREAQGAGKGGR
jgi:DUF2889 family protein